MPLVQAKCENCGGNLSVDSGLKAANCPHCGAAYVVQDAINNFNTFNKIDKLHAEVLNVVDDSSGKARLEAAEAYLKLEKYKSAYNEYCYVVDVMPQEYRGWWGLVESGTHKFTRRIKSDKKLTLYADFVDSVRKLTTQEESAELIKKWTDYSDAEKAKNQEEYDTINSSLDKLNKEEKENQKKIEELNRGVSDVYAMLNSTGRKIDIKMIRSQGITGTICVLLGVLTLIVTLIVKNNGLVLVACLSWGILFISGFFSLLGSFKMYRNHKKQTEGLCRLNQLQAQINDANLTSQVIAENRRDLCTRLEEFR